MKSHLCITVLLAASVGQAFATYAVFDAANFTKAVDMLKSNQAQERLLSDIKGINTEDLKVSEDIFKSLGTVKSYWGQGQRGLKLMKDVIPEGPMDESMGNLIKNSGSLRTMFSARTRQVTGLMRGKEISFSDALKTAGKVGGMGYDDMISGMSKEWNFKTLESAERNSRAIKELGKNMEEARERVISAKTLNETAAAQASVQLNQADIAAEQLKTQQMEAAREAASDAHQTNIMDKQESRRSTQEAVRGAFD